MRLSIKTKQVAGVSSIVGLAVVVLSGFYLASLARIRLEESRARGELLADAIYHRAREVVAKGGSDPSAALRDDAGLRSILESSAYSGNVTYAAIVDTGSIAIAHSDTARIGQPLPPYGDLDALLDRGPVVADPGDFHRRRTDARNPPTSADGNGRVRLDPHRRVHAARAARS